MESLPISQGELNRLLSRLGHTHVLRTENLRHQHPIIGRGDLSFHDLQQNIGIHVCDMVELQSASSSIELRPSFNLVILFQGRVSFSVGTRQYDISTRNVPKVFVNLVNKQDLFTRHLSMGQHVKKLTLSVPKEWLLDRTTALNDPLYGLLNLGNQVIELPLNALLQESSQQLFDVQRGQRTLANQLQAELLSLSILNDSLNRLMSDVPAVKADSVKTSVADVKCSLALKAEVEKLANENASLSYIANKLNLSPSTLQRRFKAAFQLTVQEHIRSTRLEAARNALVVEGLSIGEVAYNAGYKHVANFVTAFKKHFDITPSELRRQHMG